METKRAKSADESAIETRYLLMPRDANPLGTAFGGLIMSWIDSAASMAATRHCEAPVVTAAIDSLSFRAPILVGDHVVLKARVTYTGIKSMEVAVRVIRENPISGIRETATTAYLTFVSMDEYGVPAAVPALLCSGEKECIAIEKARLRVLARKDLRSRHDDFDV
jgi:acyl-CoA hydrolase